MKSSTSLLFNLLTLSLLTCSALAQPIPAPTPVVAPPASFAKVPSGILNQLPQEGPFKDLASEVLEEIFATKEGEDGLKNFINDLHLQPRLFQTTGADSDTSLGFEFNYKKALASSVLNPTAKNPIGIAMSLEAQGQVALNADKNPNNLIEAGGSFGAFQGIGGIDPLYTPSPAAQAQIQADILAAARHDKEARARAVKEFTAHMRPQFFYDVAGHGKIETDQQMDNRQYVYGAQLGMVFRDWRADSSLGRFNLLDYPFAAIRMRTKHEKFKPSARTFPSVVLGIDQVDPSDNNARLAVDPSTDSYGRLRIEVAFKTPVYTWGEEELHVSAVYRHFHEMSPSGAIKAAGLERSDFFVARLELPYHFNLSYSTGKLPLDFKNDQVYSVGWTLNL